MPGQGGALCAAIAIGAESISMATHEICGIKRHNHTSSLYIYATIQFEINITENKVNWLYVKA